MGLLQAGRWMSGWSERRSSILSGLTRALALPADEIESSMDWIAVPLAHYFNRSPWTYYFEPTFTEYYRFLTERYSPADLSLFASDWKACTRDPWRAIVTVERWATGMSRWTVDAFIDHEHYIHNLNLAYLRLAEEAYPSFLELPALRLQSDKGAQLTRRVFNINEVLTKHDWIWFDAYHDSTVRNGIGHDVVIRRAQFSDELEVQFRDDKNNSTVMSMSELRTFVYGLVDQCLAYAFALRLFLFEHRTAPELATLFELGRGNSNSQELYFASVASSPHLRVITIAEGNTPAGSQLVIECEDRTTNDTERMAEIISMLATSWEWCPHVDRYFLGLKGPKRMPGFVSVESKVISEWMAGRIDEGSLRRRFESEMLFPLRKPFGRFRAKWSRVVSRAHAEGNLKFQAALRGLPGKLPPGLEVLTLNDISMAMVRRCRCEILVEVASQDDVRNVLWKLTAYLKRHPPELNAQLRKRLNNMPPHWISGFIYSREKRERDRHVSSQSDFYVGRFEWRDPEVDQSLLPVPMSGSNIETILLGLTYEANVAWPPADRFVPR